jgi:hypothetical protein
MAIIQTRRKREMVSKVIICSVCGGMNIQTERRPDGDRHCLDCGSRWKIGSNQESPHPTLFDRITASPEVLAPKFVHHVTSFLDGLDKPKKIWYSTLIHGRSFASETEAKRATVARLKEVYND